MFRISQQLPANIKDDNIRAFFIGMRYRLGIRVLKATHEFGSSRVTYYESINKSKSIAILSIVVEKIDERPSFTERAKTIFNRIKRGHFD